MAINMVNMGVSAKNWQNVDSLQKRFGKNSISQKKGSKMANFLCIFVQNLKWMVRKL